MGYSSVVKRYLPRSFIGILPLQCGVELILLYSGINRMSGIFGLLSLFTNHSINFVQWMYYSANTIVLVSTLLCYIHVRRLTNQALNNNILNTDANLLTIKIISIFAIVYLIEFFTGNLFMVYLTHLWFVEEYNNTNNTTNTNNNNTQRLVKRVSNVLSLQSASESYEIFISLVTIIITETFRLYFIAVIISYYLRLRRRISRPCSGWGAFAVDLLDKIN
jgi:hypothetical protein